MAKEQNASVESRQSYSSEYSLSSKHSNVESERFGSKPNTMETENYTVKGRKKVEVMVSVEFPTMADPKAEEGFNELLKAIWLKKFEIGSRQN